MSQTQQVRGDPYVDQNPQKRCVLTPTPAEEDQTSTGRPVLVDQKEAHKLISEFGHCHMHL